jgi:hypothetical protein
MRCVAEIFLANRCIQKDEQRIRILERYHFVARRARSIISSFWKGSAEILQRKPALKIWSNSFFDPPHWATQCNLVHYCASFFLHKRAHILRLSHSDMTKV